MESADAGHACQVACQLVERSVYERMAPPFAQESARWSLSADNIRQYEQRGFSMGPEVVGPDGRGIPEREALAQLESDEFEFY
jgi:hypothetical protein